VVQSKPSKSARKREYQAVQELGEKLIDLKESELDSLTLPEELRTAVSAAKRMKSHGALRRQKQLIGKLMRQTDADQIRADLHRFGASERSAKQLFASAEQWRDRLVAEDSHAWDAFITETGSDDATLQQLLAELTATVNERREKFLRKEIFRRIHAILVARTQAG
jgi:ribosome-associated protein